MLQLPKAANQWIFSEIPGCFSVQMNHFRNSYPRQCDEVRIIIILFFGNNSYLKIYFPVMTLPVLSTDCSAEEFRCTSVPACIPKMCRCDKLVNCAGGEDEFDCAGNFILTQLYLSLHERGGWYSCTSRCDHGTVGESVYTYCRSRYIDIQTFSISVWGGTIIWQMPTAG